MIVSVATGLAAKLIILARRGQSVELNYGEDNGLWECSWITGGERYTGFSTDPERAVDAAYRKVTTDPF